MRIVYISACLFVILSSLNARADDQNLGDVRIPPGMEAKRIGTGDNYVVIPKGGRIRVNGGVMTIESAEEYSARNFEDVDGRISKIEKEQDAIKKELKELKELNELKEPKEPKKPTIDTGGSQ